MRALIRRSWKFLTVGAISSVIELTVFNVLVFGMGLDAVTAKVIAVLVATVNAYFGNREWAFRSRAGRSRGAEIALFLAVNAVCLALGAAIVALGVALVGSPGPLALNLINVASIGIVVVVRFAFYHFIVFPSQKTGEHRPVEAAEVTTP